MPQERILFLESVRHEVAAVIMPQRQAAGGAGVDAVELVSHRHADGLKSFEAGPALGDMPTEQLGVPVLGDAEQPDLAVLDGGDLGVSRPKGLRLRPLSEPDVNLAAHPAPIIHPKTDSPSTNGRTRVAGS